MLAIELEAVFADGGGGGWEIIVFVSLGLALAGLCWLSVTSPMRRFSREALLVSLVAGIIGVYSVTGVVMASRGASGRLSLGSIGYAAALVLRGANKPSDEGSFR